MAQAATKSDAHKASKIQEISRDHKIISLETAKGPKPSPFTNLATIFILDKDYVSTISNLILKKKPRAESYHRQAHPMGLAIQNLMKICRIQLECDTQTKCGRISNL